MIVKRLLLCILAFLMMLNAAVLVSAEEEQPIRIIINGEELVCAVPPIIADNTVLIPIRPVFEKFSLEVKWDDDRKMVETTTKLGSLLLRIGTPLVLRNFTDTFLLDTAPRLVGGSTMVPIKFVADSLGVNVNWVKSDRTVVIVKAN